MNNPISVAAITDVARKFDW